MFSRTVGNRSDYTKALPSLERYYAQLNNLSARPFDVNRAARLELEWWIVRRERDRHPPSEWAQLLADLAGELYHLPSSRFREHARLRVKSMLYRDARNGRMTESDWQHVRQVLEESWKALYKKVND